MNLEQHVLARYPFPISAHAWKGQGNNKRVYIQKEAILARLALIDPNYQFGRPEYLSEIDDVITVTGCLVLGGVEQWGVGTGVITRFRNEGEGANKKRVEISGNELATERAKAHKSAVTDLQARIPILFGVGEYMKRIPAAAKSDESKFNEWLSRITADYPVPESFVSMARLSPFGEVFQTPSLGSIGGTTPAPAPTRWANEGTVSLLFRNFRANVADLETGALLWLAGIEKQDAYSAWNTRYPTGKAAGGAMQEAYYANRPDVEAVWNATRGLYSANRSHFENSFKKHVGIKMMTTDDAVRLLTQRREEAEREKAG